MYTKVLKAKIITNDSHTRSYTLRSVSRAPKKMHDYIGMLENIFRRNKSLIRYLQVPPQGTQQRTGNNGKLQNIFNLQRSGKSKTLSKQNHKISTYSQNVINHSLTTRKLFTVPHNNKVYSSIRDRILQKNGKLLAEEHLKNEQNEQVYFIPMGQISLYKNKTTKKCNAEYQCLHKLRNNICIDLASNKSTQKKVQNTKHRQIILARKKSNNITSNSVSRLKTEKPDQTHYYSLRSSHKDYQQHQSCCNLPMQGQKITPW